MALGRVAFRTHSRRQGHTAAAALAYRHGAKLVDALGEMHDYRRRARADAILADGVTAPDRWAHGDDLQALANCIESAERRKDARLCRDVQIALPHELEQEAQEGLVVQYAGWLQERYDTPVAWAMHAPDPGPGHDERNVHAHLILPSRRLGDDGSAFGAKLRKLDCPGTAAEEVTEARNVWADLANEALDQAGVSASVNVGRKLPTGGHARYSRIVALAIRRLPPHVKSLFNDVRRLLTAPPDADGGLLASSLILSARQYFALAYARAPVPQWAQPSLHAPQVGSAIDDLLALWWGLKPPAGSPRAILARPRKVKNVDGKAVWGAAIVNPPGTLAPGDLLEIHTRRGRLRSAEIAEIQSRTSKLAIVSTGPQAEILLRAARSSGEVVEIRREADRSVTFTDHGDFGRVRGGKVTLSSSSIGDELAAELGAQTVQIDDVLQRMAEALQNDGARILYSASASVNAPVTSVTDSRPKAERARERRRRRRRRRRRPDKTPVYDAAWAVESMRETSRQVAEAVADTPEH